jgi:Mg2+ and Co2+ transporter CorA
MRRGSKKYNQEMAQMEFMKAIDEHMDVAAKALESYGDALRSLSDSVGRLAAKERRRRSYPVQRSVMK